MLLADSFTMCQTAFTVISSPHVLPTLLTRRNSFPRSIAAAASQSSSSVAPNREPEPFERGLPCRPDQQWPNAPRAAGDDPLSKPRLHVSSTHTRVAMQARLGHAFLSAADDRVTAKAHCLALPSTSCRGECPASSPL